MQRTWVPAGGAACQLAGQHATTEALFDFGLGEVLIWGPQRQQWSLGHHQIKRRQRLLKMSTALSLTSCR